MWWINVRAGVRQKEESIKSGGECVFVVVEKLADLVGCFHQFVLQQAVQVVQQHDVFLLVVAALGLSQQLQGPLQTALYFVDIIADFVLDLAFDAGRRVHPLSSTAAH